MANHKSAEKRSRQNVKKHIKNKSVKTQIKTVVKEVRNITTNDDKTKEVFKKAQSVIDKAAKKGVLHKKTAARKKARLSAFINKLSA